MTPLPKHLKGILAPMGDANDEFHLTGKIVCNCGCESFALEFVGDASQYKTENVIKVAEIDGAYFLIVKAKCTKCSNEHLIFDKHFHGWNGFVLDTDSRELPRPKTATWDCNKCGRPEHFVTVEIQSEGKQSFLDETYGDFDEEEWVEAFAWIAIKTICVNCRETNKEWISYETM